MSDTKTRGLSADEVVALADAIESESRRVEESERPDSAFHSGMIEGRADGLAAAANMIRKAACPKPSPA